MKTVFNSAPRYKGQIMDNSEIIELQKHDDFNEVYFRPLTLNERITARGWFAKAVKDTPKNHWFWSEYSRKFSSTLS